MFKPLFQSLVCLFSITRLTVQFPCFEQTFDLMELITYSEVSNRVWKRNVPTQVSSMRLGSLAIVSSRNLHTASLFIRFTFISKTTVPASCLFFHLSVSSTNSAATRQLVSSSFYLYIYIHIYIYIYTYANDIWWLFFCTF